jgi:hypothetical protein
MSHSYEEIRAVAIDILAGRENTSHGATQYANLEAGIAEVFARRTGCQGPQNVSGSDAQLERQDADLFLEVFWDLFRQGIITLGFNRSNREFPFFRVSQVGQRILQNQSVYFFHDVSTYTAVIQKEVPAINAVTLIYLQEAMQAFRSGCILSATVMLGVATEHTFLLLVETILQSKSHAATFAAVDKERTILQKVNKFKSILDQHTKGLPREILEDLDTHFSGILSIIRNFRNQSGHPSGKIIDREQAYVLLQLFIPYCRKMYQLQDQFR